MRTLEKVQDNRDLAIDFRSAWVELPPLAQRYAAHLIDEGVVDDVSAAESLHVEADELEPPLRALAEARGWKAGDLFMAIRVAVSGRTVTPPLFDTLVALGKDRALARLDRALAALAA